jgi:hypothetical protein
MFMRRVGIQAVKAALDEVDQASDVLRAGGAARWHFMKSCNCHAQSHRPLTLVIEKEVIK